MSEYWKSQAKFWCKFCKIYVTDNKISRQNHDNGKKHKDNVSMYLRDVDRRSKADEKKTEAMKREMAKIEAVRLERRL